MAVVTIPYGPGETHTTLVAAIAGEAPYDLVALGTEELVFEATSAFEDDNASPLFGAGSYTTDATHRVVIRPQVAHQHDGTIGNGYRLSAANFNSGSDGPLLRFNGIHYTLDGVALVGGGELGVGKKILLLYPTAASSGIANRCLIHGAVNGFSNAKGIQNIGASTLVMNNCAVFDNAGQGILADGGAAGSVKLVNSTVADNGTVGLDITSGNNQFTLVNTVVTGNATDIATNAVTVTGNDWNLTSDTTAPGTNTIKSFSPAYVNAVGGDYHLATADDTTITTAWGASPTKSLVDTLVSGWLGLTTIWNPDLDVDGGTRTDPRSPGFDEFGVGAPVGPPVSGGFFDAVLGTVLVAPLSKV